MQTIAADTPRSAPAQANLDLLVFEIDDQRFAIRAAQSREIIRAVAVTPLPGAPPVVEGVINVRGTTVPVLDIRARFGLPARELLPTEHFVIAWTGARTVVLRVTRVTELAAVDAATIDDPGEITRGVKHIAGVVRMPDGLVLLHDIERFLDAGESESLDAALAQHNSAAAP